MAVDRQRLGGKRDRLRQLQVFSEVARRGSITRAAEHLGLTQPAVSLQVRELEDELQAYLLDRSGSGVSLTLAGERLLGRVEPLIERMETLFGNYSDLFQDGVSGRLELAASAAGAASVLPRFARRLRDLHPGIRLRVRKCGLSEGMAMLRADDVELVLGVADSDPDPAFEYREVVSYDIVFIASLDHPLAGRESVSLEEAAAWPAIVPPTGTSGRQFGEAVARRFGIEVQNVVEVGGWDVLKRYVENGIGVSAVPRICIDELDRVSVIPIQDHLPSRSFGVFTRRGRDLTAPARELLVLMVGDS